MSVSTHVLDASRGRPATGMQVRLEGRGWHTEGKTDEDGRLRYSQELEPGTYRLTFGTGEYFAGLGAETFYPEVTVTFTIAEAAEHYHVPLLLSPFSYSTYRGS